MLWWHPANTLQPSHIALQPTTTRLTHNLRSTTVESANVHAKSKLTTMHKLVGSWLHTNNVVLLETVQMKLDRLLYACITFVKAFG